MGIYTQAVPQLGEESEAATPEHRNPLRSSSRLRPLTLLAVN